MSLPPLPPPTVRMQHGTDPSLHAYAHLDAYRKVWWQLGWRSPVDDPEYAGPDAPAPAPPWRGPPGPPGPVAATGLATYDDQTGVLDVAASAVESIVADEVNALPEIAGTESIATDDTTEGLLRLSRRGVVVPQGPDVNNTTTETSLLAESPVIPGGLLDKFDGMVSVWAVGIMVNTTGQPRSSTFRMRLYQGDDLRGTWTWQVTDLPVTSATGVPWRIDVNWLIVDLFTAAVPSGNGALQVADPDGDLHTSQLAMAIPNGVMADLSVPIRVDVTVQHSDAVSGNSARTAACVVRHTGTVAP